MNVLIISDRLTTTTQLRFALSAVKHPCSVSDATYDASLASGTEQLAGGLDIVFITIPVDEEFGIRVLKETRPRSSARIVAVGLAESPQQMLRILHAGADDFIDEAGDIPLQVRAVLDRVALTIRDSSPQPVGSLISVTGAVGGAGSTLTAANLAVLLSSGDRSCGLIDLSGGFGELATLFAVKPRYTLSELCSNWESLDLEMLRNSITEHSSGVKLIASAAVTSEWEFDSTEATRHVVKTSRRMLPHIVLDLNRRAPFSRDLLAESDLIVLLTTLDFRAACCTQRLLESWAERGVAADRIVLVASRCRRKAELDVGMVESVLNRKFDLRLTDDPHSANLSVNCGNPAVLECPHGSLPRELCELQRIVEERISGEGTPSTDEGNGRPGRSRKAFSGLLKRVAGAFF